MEARLRLRTKIFLAVVFGVLVAAATFTYYVRTVLRTSYRQSVEEMMVDMSQLLASLAEENVGKNSQLDTTVLEKMFENYKGKTFQAKIYELRKQKPSLDVYITDSKGIVLYSSRDKNDVGKDFSRWNDVLLTLQGKYGARRTRKDPNDPQASVFYVGSPITKNGQIIGSLSIIKDRRLISQIVSSTFLKIGELAAAVLAALFVFQSLLFFWITRPLQSLQKYAREVALRKRVTLPALSGREIQEVGRAFEEMRIALEGKKTIEQFTQALTHEIKSPISAIKGAAELTLEPMQPNERERFLRNIIQEATRAQSILEKLLQVAALESKTSLDRVETVSIPRLIESVCESLLGLTAPKEIKIDVVATNAKSDLQLQGEAFLLEQCLRNLLQNAVEFSPTRSEIKVILEKVSSKIRIVIEDNGIGIPAFAKEKVFDKFFSLERPDTQRKGTGLGLSFTREVVSLHRGTIQIESPIDHGRGTRATLELPIAAQAVYASATSASY